jgi:ElaB/YqjD/DUF883 family membrane-anchored ribosome-binding protein
MANEDMIGSRAQNKGAHSEKKARHTAEDLKSAAPAVAEKYTKKASKARDEAKERVRTLREDGEDYVRQNPMKAVLTALGVGYVLSFFFRR